MTTAADAVDEALALLAGEALAPARRALAGYRDQCAEPMRVALVGRVSSGKSTLVNALLGSKVVATGVEKLTFNVNWLYYSRHASVVVYYKDDRPPEHRSLADLEALTVRSEHGAESLREIDYLHIGYPNDYLQAFDLIDTPGLDSYFGEDSANTERFLGLGAVGAHGSTLDHAAKADALVLVFARGAAESDRGLLGQFHGSGPMASIATPLTAVGALTMVEGYWDPDGPDPLHIGRRVAGDLMTEGGAGRYLYDLYPLASLVGEGAAVMDDQDFDDLVQLAATDRGELADLLSHGPRFVAHDQKLTVPPVRRHALFDQFSGYGIALACDLLRDGVADRAALRTELEQRSGMTEFRRSLVEHFGARADLIKLQRLVSQARRMTHAVSGLTPQDQLGLEQAVAKLTDLEVKEHAFREIAVLRDLYAGQFDLSEDAALDLKRVLGERGPTPAQRLGLPASAGPDELRRTALAGHARWSALALEVRSGETSRAIRVLLRRYEILISSLGSEQL